MAITSAVGVGSGIDINGTVSQLTAAEGKPQLDAIAAKANVSQSKLSGLGTLKGALSSFQNAVKQLDQNTTFQSQQITSSDEKILKVSVDPASTAAAHTVKIVSLANAQKSISSVEFKTGDVVTEGVLIFNDGKGTPKFSAIVKKGENDTLEGLRDAINNAKGNNTVVASIVNVDSKTSPNTTVSRLVLTAKTPGSENSFTIDASIGDSRFNLDSVKTPTNYSTTDATDAKVVIDPQPVGATAQRSVANLDFSNDEVVKPGVISFKDASGNERFSVDIVKGSNDRFFQVIDAINKAAGNDLVTVTAENSKLVFTAKKSGIENKFSIDASKGDSNLTLSSAPVNAQKSVLKKEFSNGETIAPGTLTFKDSAGEAKFSINVVADQTVTKDLAGNILEKDADGNVIIPTDDNNFPVETKTETIKGSNNTLEELKNAINYSPYNKGLVEASIATISIPQEPVATGEDDAEGNPIFKTPDPIIKSQLVLTALKSGFDNGFSIDASLGDFNFALDKNNSQNFVTSTTVAMFDTTDASDAGDGGQIVTRSSNTISDAIPGVSLNLLATGSVDINVQQDKANISKPITSFVDAYNTLNSTLKQLTNYVKPGDSANGALLGDSTVQSVISQIKNVINSKVSSAADDFNTLNQLGISFDKKGAMQLDSSKLDAALTQNLTSVGNIFSSTDGVATQLSTKLTQFLDAKSAISLQQDSLNKTLTDLSTQKANVQKSLEAKQKSLQAQFIAMDTAVSQFKNTGTFLTQAFAPKPTN